MTRQLIILVIILAATISCSKNDDTKVFYSENSFNDSNIGQENNTGAINNNSNESNHNNENNNSVNYSVLSLGDSYTIGQSVCENCGFPSQLKDNILNRIPNSSIVLDVIAQTGWNTSDLINSIYNQNPSENYDLVTLLIGVNNQFQYLPFEVYQEEFPQLLETAISLAFSNSEKVIVLSIPDYAFTPFGQNFPNHPQISSEIDQYNNFAEAICAQNNVTFINITDITREGLVNPNLIAYDNLHPSELAYARFVERLLPFALEKID